MANAIEIVINAINNAGKVLSDVKSGLDDVGESAKKSGVELTEFGKNTAVIGAKMTAGFTLPIVAAGTAATMAASNLEETLNKTNAVFGDSANSIVQWSQTSSESFGLSQQAALDAAATFGNLFGAQGFDPAAAEGMSTSLVQLAADLASFNNIGVDEALVKLQSGIVGETEPLRQLGVNLSAAAVEAEVLASGMAASKDEITEQMKVQARLNIIMEQTATAQGDFAATSDSLANKQRIVRAELANVSAELGAQLLPVAVMLVEVVGQVVEAFSNLSPQMQQTIIVGGAVVAAIGPLLTTVGLMVSAFGALAPAVGAVVSILGALLSPVGLIVAAVGGLLAILFDWGGANERVAQTLQQWGLSGAADFVRGLHEGMSGLVESVKDLFAGNMTFAEFFDAAIPEWIATLFSWTWPILAPIAWMVKLMEWAWPNFDKPDWIENLLNFRWPKFPSRPAWLGGDGGGNATGTSYFQGGTTWVGETGPELVSLPRGSQIFPAGESRRMAAAGMAGGGVNIVINANVTNESDITRLARRVADELQRRGR